LRPPSRNPYVSVIADYDKTLAPVYGDAASPEDIVVEGGVVE
jgi:hypothetical protein